MHANGVKALVMELVDGEDQRIARGAIRFDEALLIATQIAEALEAADDQGIVHRDLRAANVKVRADGTVEVLDFGLANAGADGRDLRRVAVAHDHGSRDDAGRRDPHGRLATSPEQARGRVVDKRTDVRVFGPVRIEVAYGSTGVRR